jgi:ribosomal protein S18 acetylase RimI-like enzyme
MTLIRIYCSYSTKLSFVAGVHQFIISQRESEMPRRRRNEPLCMATSNQVCLTAPRRLTASDVEDLRTLLRLCWLDTYTSLLPESVIQTAINTWQSKESLLGGLQNPRTFYSGWFEDGKLVGMVSAGKTSENTIKVYQLYVLPSHQRRGIGSKLMNSAIEYFGAKKVVLEVEEGNRKGISFYGKFGFTYPGKTVVKVGEEEIPCLSGELQL